MFKITKARILFIIIAIPFILIHVFMSKYKIETEINENIMEERLEIFETKYINEKKQTCQTEIWQIEIPIIGLTANIQEGTDKETLNKYIGHFESTQKENGNIGLAGHNRGYNVNYFQDLKLLKEGDEIKYRHNRFEKIYEVEKNRIIKDIDWEYLENTEENTLTLITCVENQAEYRRCVQAVEKEEEKY